MKEEEQEWAEGEGEMGRGGGALATVSGNPARCSGLGRPFSMILSRTTMAKPLLIQSSDVGFPRRGHDLGRNGHVRQVQKGLRAAGSLPAVGH